MREAPFPLVALALAPGRASAPPAGDAAGDSWKQKILSKGSRNPGSRRSLAGFQN